MPVQLPSSPGAIVGVLGGMGPAATADFYTKLVRATPATSDQGHIRTLIWSDPSIPDRTAALLARGPDPTPALRAGALLLREAGARIIAVPCNTAHAFIPRVQADVGIPFVDMVGDTAERIRADHPAVSKVGVLATSGTRESGLYDAALRRRGLEPVLPSWHAQEHFVMRAIHRVKSGRVDSHTTRLAASAARELLDAGAEVVIAGCTELPIALRRVMLPVPVIDPTQVLAESVIRRMFTESPHILSASAAKG